MLAAEILSIGTELLLGQILDTNAQFLSAELAELGVSCYWRTTVGDNRERIGQCVRQALDRVDLVITTGGLGPTADDLTIECLAAALDVPQVFDEPTLERIRALFASRGMVMPESNRKQALRPQGSEILPNPVGTAPGIIWKLDSDLLERAGIAEPSRSRFIITFPGVPSEMKAMWRETARSFVSQIAGAGTIWSCELKHYGIGESALAELHAGLLEMSNPTVAPLAGPGECRLRVTARAKTVEEAQEIARPAIEEIEAKGGVWCYGRDQDTLESVVGALLTERGATLAVAESCTGGLVSKLLTDVPGSSAYVALNVVTYSNEAKHEMLGVHEYILEQKGAVSPECAHAMATGIRKLAGADIGVGVTGVAGPGGGTAEKPVGLVYVALVAEHFQADKTLKFPSEMSRKEIRERTAREALNMVRLYLLAPEKLHSRVSR